MKKKLAIVIIPILMPFVILHASDAEYLNYQELILKIEIGRVQSVTIGSCRSIRGVYTENNIEKGFTSWHEDEAANDPLFISLLKDNNVEIVIEEGEREDMGPFAWVSSFFGIFFFGTPLISLVLVIIIPLKVNRLTPKAEIRTKP